MKKGKSLAYIMLSSTLIVATVFSDIVPNVIYADKEEGEETDSGEELDQEFEAYLDKQGFPESYRVALRELHKKYPSWKFEAFHTNLDWNDVIEAEMYQARNLIPNSGYATSFYDTQNPWSYDWLSDQWNILSSPYWIQVSAIGLSYYMDPRNWLTEDHIFEFEKLSYNEDTQSLAAVEQILKGTFMENALVDGSKENPHFDSHVLCVNNEIVTGVAPVTNVKQVLANLELYDDERYELSVCTKDYKTKQVDELVGTGDRIRVVEWVPYEVVVEPEKDDSEEILEPVVETRYKAEYVTSYEIIVFGDISGDGRINTTDRVYLKSYLNGNLVLDNAQLRAADIDQNGKINTTDRVYLKSHINKALTIDQTLKNNGITYAEAFYELGKELNVSPIMLSYRVRIEQGVKGTSELISGDVYGYEGYYNYYNIGAYGGTRMEIVRNGMNEAVSEGWNTRYKALQGGARKLVSGHIAKGQDTIYLQKFDVEGDYYGYFWHQYMQNVTAPFSEGYSAYKAYRELGILSSEFAFKIPVYNNMPEEACGEPKVTGNPNTRLNSLYIEGYRFTATFSVNGFKYKTTIPKDVTEIKICAEPISDTTTVEGTGIKEITPETNELHLITTAENGDQLVYIIYLIRSE